MVDVTDSNVVSNVLMQVVVEDLTPDVDHGFAVEKIMVFGGNSSQTIDNECDVSLLDLGEGRYTFTTPTYPFLKLTIKEKESAGYPVGTFTQFTASQPSSSLPITIYEYDLTMKSYPAFMGSFYGYVNAAKNVFVSVKKEDKSDTAVSSYVLQAAGLNAAESYGIFTVDDATFRNNCYQQFVSLTLNDGSVVRYVWDYVNAAIYWDVTLEVISGDNEKTTGSVVEIKSASGERLMKTTIQTSKGQQAYYGTPQED